MRGVWPRNATLKMIVIRHSRGRQSTKRPTEMRAHQGIAGGNLGSTRGWSGAGASFISVISLGLMTILSIGLQAPPLASRGLLLRNRAPRRCLGTVLPCGKMVQEYGLYTGSPRKAQGHDSPAVPCFPGDSSACL